MDQHDGVHALNCIPPPIIASAATLFESTGVPPRLHVTRRDFASRFLFARVSPC